MPKKFKYKGKTFLDTGYIYAPYIPIQVTQVISMEKQLELNSIVMLNHDTFLSGRSKHNLIGFVIEIIHNSNARTPFPTSFYKVRWLDSTSSEYQANHLRLATPVEIIRAKNGTA
jgi:hypothetical protein